MKWDLLRGMWEAGMIKFGDFTLTSGKKSPYYMDLRALPSHVQLFKLAIDGLQSLVERSEQADFGVSSVELSGIPLGAALAARMGRPFVYVRKEAKSHGTGGLVEGDVSRAKLFIVIDDVLTTGGSVLSAARALRERGAEVRSAYVLLDRLQGGSRLLEDNGIGVRSLTDIRDAVGELSGRGVMSADQRDTILRYLGSEGASV